MLNDLQNYQRAKREYEAALTCYQAELAGAMAALRETYRLDSLREYLERQRDSIDSDALLAYEHTNRKTVFSKVGYVVTVAVSESPVVIDHKAACAAIDAAGLGDALTERDILRVPFIKWVKTQRDIGVEVPGVEFRESRSVRVTLPKEVARGE